MPSKVSPSLRLAVPGDLDALVRIENLAFTSDRISRRSFRELLTRPTAAFVVHVSDDGRITGYAMLLLRRGTAMARLYSLAIDPDHAGKGIGALLYCRERCQRDSQVGSHSPRGVI